MDGSPQTSSRRNVLAAAFAGGLDRSTVSPLRPRYVTQLIPRESASIRPEVWGHYENADGVCLPTGEFAFSETYTVESEPDEPTFEWAFSLRVEDAA